ncbi:MAG: Tex-like N-terminal domain-containing protein [Gemmataceae bacterium]
MSSEATTAQPHSLLNPNELSRLAQDLQIRKVQVENAIQLLEQGNTVPFIARYRRERTLGLEEEAIRIISNRMQQARSLAERKQIIVKSIEAQGKLTEPRRDAIVAAETYRRLEDLYLPYKPKKKSVAAEAREKGLEPFALAVWMKDDAVSNLAEVAPTLVNPEKQVNSPEDVLTGTRSVIAELIAETADVRAAVRRYLWDNAKLVVTRLDKLPEGKGLEYKDYFQFTEPASRVPPHRILAINRGERENALAVRLEFDPQGMREVAIAALPALVEHPHREFILTCVDEALARIIQPSLEREIRRELTDFALSHAISVFARNLRGLLMQPPLHRKRILAIDPGFRTGCKLAVIDETGTPLEDKTVFPHQPQNKTAEARKAIERLIRKYQTPIVAIGNGAACRETEEIVASLISEFDARRRGETVLTSPDAAAADPTPIQEGDIPPVDPTPTAVMNAVPAEKESPPPEEPAMVGGDVNSTVDTPQENVPIQDEVPPAVIAETPPDLTEPIAPPPEPEPEYPEPPLELAYVIINEAGASDYATSAIGREEFPNLDPAIRATISLGRRLQDPISELVKIDPQHVGVGLYQHDVHGKHLKSSLEAVIESCVNHVGVDVNTAHVPLLRHVAGLNQSVARDIVEFRHKNGPFRTREQLTQIPSVPPARFVQAAGFLKVANGDEPLDATWIHPESYRLARNVLQDLGHTPSDLRDHDRLQALRQAFDRANIDELARKFEVLPPTICELFDALARPGRDPREDSPLPVFRRDVLRLEDLKPGMELKGTVLNVVDFGAFIDIGLKDSGLVHISQLANRFIRNPHEVVTVGDVVTAWVMTVDSERHRVSLTMIQPGSERKPQDRRGQEATADSGQRFERPAHEGQRGGERGRPRRGQQRRGQPRQEQPAGVEMGAGPEAASGVASPPRRGGKFERKPPKPKPLPKLSAEKREGKAYLTTLGELEAFFKSREGPSTESPATPEP